MLHLTAFIRQNKSVRLWNFVLYLDLTYASKREVNMYTLAY